MPLSLPRISSPMAKISRCPSTRVAVTPKSRRIAAGTSSVGASIDPGSVAWVTRNATATASRPSPVARWVQPPYLNFSTLVAFARWCDFLMVATPGGATTVHLVDTNVLEALGPDGFLINIARGSVVDTAALGGA